MKYNIQLLNRGLKAVTFSLILPFVNKKGVEEEVVVSGKCKMAVGNFCALPSFDCIDWSTKNEESHLVWKKKLHTHHEGAG